MAWWAVYFSILLTFIVFGWISADAHRFLIIFFTLSCASDKVCSKNFICAYNF